MPGDAATWGKSLFAIQYGGEGGTENVNWRAFMKGATEEIASHNLEDRKWRALKERYRMIQHGVREFLA